MKDLLVGTWRLLKDSYETVEGGESFSLLGDHSFGMLIYTSNDYMSVFLAKADRPNFASNDPLMGTPEEQSDAFSTYVSYCGRYTIDEAKKAVIHHIEAAWYPNWVNTSKLRYFTLEGRQLTLASPPQTLGGKEYVAKLIWERI